MPSSLRTKLRSLWSRKLRIVRRVHMYAGLLLLPWLLFFGISGLSFNHPNVGEDVRGQRLGPAELERMTGLTPWPAAQVARAVVGELNQAAPGAYTLDASFASRYDGVVVLKAPSPDGLHMLLLNPDQAVAILATKRARPSSGDAPFATKANLPEYSLAAVEDKLATLLEQRRLPAQGALRGQPQLTPKLEFRMRDRQGVSWNVTYDLATGQVAGRESDSFPSIGVGQLLAKLHTTHHFPMGMQARWFWALFEDLLALAMVVWALSGLLMWWQMKPTRVAGAISLALALGVAALVMVGTARQVFFGDVREALGPGE